MLPCELQWEKEEWNGPPVEIGALDTVYLGWRESRSSWCRCSIIRQIGLQHVEACNGECTKVLQLGGSTARCVDHRGVKKKKEYLVRWKGYDSEEDSWIKEKNVTQSAITEYRQYLKNKDTPHSQFPNTHMRTIPNDLSIL